MQNKLYKKAKEVVGKFQLNGVSGNSAGVVAAALLAKNGKIYTGINMNLACGIGFCAEASAISDMLKDRETVVDTVIAVSDKGHIIPPCGRCRELLYQIDKKNLDTKVIISETETRPLKDLLPQLWVDSFYK